VLQAATIARSFSLARRQFGEGDGRELYYSVHAVPARMMAVDIVAKGHTIHAGIPRLLFQV
jgi:hypothetical protein